MTEKPKPGEIIHVGDIGVDSGTILIGDPCYDGAPENFYMLEESSPGVRDLGLYQLIINTYHGDGLYPVFVEYGENGSPRRVTIDFDPFED